MAAAELLRLAERVEALTGPDREVDVAIWETFVSSDDYRRANHWPRYSDWESHVSGTWEPFYPNLNAKKYTSSLEAAMSLVPEGFAISDWMIWPGEKSKVVVIGTRLRPFGTEKKDSWVHDFKKDGKWRGEADTPALALTAAALRALAAQADGVKQ